MDYDDWMLNPVVFRELDFQWGPHTVDRLQTGTKTKLRVLIPVTIAQEQKALMPLHVTGDTITSNGAPHYI